MATIPDLPEDLDRALDLLSAHRRMPKGDLVAEAVRAYVERHRRQIVIEEGFQFALTHDREAMERLADA